MIRCFVLAVLAVAAASPALAQGFDMGRNNGEQIQVSADEGIEWLSQANRVVARGNAKASRGSMTVAADSLTAHYRDGAKGNEIWRLDAEGNVVISSPTQKATGSHATYDLDKAVVVLRGQPVRLTTPKERVEASESLEYWEAKRLAVARGDAVAVQGGRTLKADVLTTTFRQGGKGSGMEISHADAYGHVVLTTPAEQVRGDRADYNVESGVATVAGSVKILRDGNQLEGGYAHVDLNSGISKLFGSAPGKPGGDGRVRGLLMPEKPGGDKRRAVFGGPGQEQGLGQDQGQPDSGGR